MTTDHYDAERYAVIRYPNGYNVIDKQDGNRTVSTHGSRKAAHDAATKLNHR
jgi:hypothetical protein